MTALQAIQLKAIRQTPNLCGPASLVSLLDYYGITVSEAELARICKATPALGTHPENIVRGLRQLGLRVEARRNGTLEQIGASLRAGRPVLVLWWSDYASPPDGHYSVVYHITPRFVQVMDPELGGFRRMGRATFLRQWYDVDPSTNRRISRWYLTVRGRGGNSTRVFRAVPK